MKRLFARMSLTQKVFAISLVVSLAVTAVAVTVMIGTERSLMRERIVSELVAQSEIVAFNSAASLVFDDGASATDILSALRAVSSVKEAILFNQKNDVFARYNGKSTGRSKGSYTEISSGLVKWPEGLGRGVVFSDDGIYIYAPVSIGDVRVGSLYIRSSLDRLESYSSQALAVGLAALLLAIVVALALLAPMVSVVSEPVASLLHTVNAVRRNKDYQLRAVRMANDEFGELADAFNAMLEEIDHRDHELFRQQMQLEGEVMDRTQALKKTNRHLEETVRALQQANRAIRVSEENKRVAEASAEDKAQFLANMSHELRTPMHGVLGMLSLLLETQLSSDQQHYVEVAHESGNILLELLNNVLDLSKIEHNKLALERVEFDLRQAIEEVVVILGESANSKLLELVVWQNASVPSRVVGDPIRLKQIVFNLLGNAIKFTTQGHVEISYAVISENTRRGVVDSAEADFQAQEQDVSESVGDELWIRFDVSDTGVGLSEDVQEKIFEAFTQADSTTTRVYGGSGLGLALCKQIVKLMGGAIGVESELGKGSKFWFEIPFGKTPQTLPALREIALNSNKVMVLDGKKVSAEAMRHYLAELEVDCVLAANEFDVLTLLESGGALYFRLLISLDTKQDTIYHLLKAPTVRRELDDANIVFYGSIQQRNDFRLLKEYAGFDVLTKPIRLSQLRRAFGFIGNVHVAGALPVVHGASSLRILVVEDHPINRQVAVGLLKKLGFVPEVAENGEIALKMMQNQAYDLILMDLQMPVMDGYSTTRTVRQWEREGRRRTPIIAMTAHALSGDRERCAEAGMDDYLAKPVKAELLMAVLGKWLPKPLDV
ncbi:sensory box histidine kinase/response regulator [gamma proteobacterium HdN1]|nr:sensory box histidine kinase/response regulator [gamma proteobacterium HdN1]